MVRYAFASLAVLATGLLVVACGDGKGPVCCVVYNAGEAPKALTCDDASAVANCENFDFSDCYRDAIRDDEC